MNFDFLEELRLFIQRELEAQFSHHHPVSLITSVGASSVKVSYGNDGIYFAPLHDGKLMITTATEGAKNPFVILGEMDDLFLKTFTKFLTLHTTPRDYDAVSELIRAVCQRQFLSKLSEKTEPVLNKPLWSRPRRLLVTV